MMKRAIFFVTIFFILYVSPGYPEDYPFGIYGTWSVKDNDRAFSLVSEKGFNLVEIPPDKTILDQCKKYKIKAFVSFNLSKTVATDKVALEQFTESMLAKVNELKDHPALFGWYIVDEPNLKGIPRDVVTHLYRKLKTSDQIKPVYSYLAYPGTWDNYLDTADIIGISGYLRKGEKVEIVKERIHKIRKDLKKEGLTKKVWLVLHAFDYKFKDRQSPYKTISVTEFRKSWQIALNENIDGLMVYTLGSLPRVVPIEPYSLPKDRPDIWQEIDTLKKHIETLQRNN